jgi:two-component system phosphate regulon sensor histidine kinase PhoR
MVTKIRWRIAIPFFLFFALILLVLGLLLVQPTCLGSARCVWRYLLEAAIVTAVTTYVLALQLELYANRYTRHIAEVAQRITAGDLEARVLGYTSDEGGEMTKAFSEMVAALRDQIHTLQAENQQYSTILTSMTDGVLITGENGTVRLLNPAATRLLEPMSERAIGRSFAEVVRHHHLIELWQKASQTRQEQVEMVEINRGVFLQTAVIPFEEEGTRRFLVILHDLTQIHRLQTVRRDFISNISHELRTPLASLKAVIETLQDGALDDPPAAEHFLHRAENEVDVLTQMVEELLELSRIESGQVPFRFQATAVSNLLLGPMDRLRPQAQRKGIEMVLDVPANLPTVLADEERVQRVVTNLLHNAVKFTPDGGRVTVQASLSPEHENELRISVIDTGVGVAEEDLSRIFERFYKSDRARTRNGGGTGLGLAISRHIVQAHHGRIGVASQEGKGSTFYFTLPISR